MIILVPEGGSEGHDLQQALSAHYSSLQATAACDIQLMGSDSGSWQPLLQFKALMQLVRQGSVVLVVPNSKAALTQLVFLLVKLDAAQLVLLASSAAIPPPSQQPEHAERDPVCVACSSFTQVHKSAVPQLLCDILAASAAFEECAAASMLAVMLTMGPSAASRYQILRCQGNVLMSMR